MSQHGPHLTAVTLSLKQANAIVDLWHRHHGSVRGHKFSIGVWDLDANCLVGVAIVGRPTAKAIDHRRVTEVLRVATKGTKNACSFLYGACARTSKELGFSKITTTILDEETGASLRGAGWERVKEIPVQKWSRPSRPRKSRPDEAHAKVRYEKKLSEPKPVLEREFTVQIIAEAKALRARLRATSSASARTRPTHRRRSSASLPASASRPA